MWLCARTALSTLQLHKDAAALILLTAAHTISDLSARTHSAPTSTQRPHALLVLLGLGSQRGAVFAQQPVRNGRAPAVDAAAASTSNSPYNSCDMGERRTPHV